ncbi:MAG: serine/threonine protein kinase [Deltaproteobacteria bacterium]|nr:serine/threonine protein kinase [Deltaproteobacteria bacterium]
MLSSAPTSPQYIGRYELLGVIGTGGMGRIYLARVSGEGGFEREVALKVMHEHLLVEEEFVAMFLDEARLAARIRHPNVVSTLDVQKAHNALFLVMDLVEGLSLADVFKRRRIRAPKNGAPGSTNGDSDSSSSAAGRSTPSGAATLSSLSSPKSRPKRYEPLPVDIACRIAIDMLKGLHAAHELTDRDGTLLNLVHRDVSPGNVLIGKDGIARITDFGVARAETRLTATIGGQIKGKIPYMPPEQLVADAIDRRADVYAAGVVLWEMLSGRRLFRNKNQGTLIQEILKGAQVRPGQLRPDVPRTLDHVCMRALTIDLERRFGSAAEFAAELKNAIRMTGRPGAASEDVADFVAEYGTNLEHMDAARRSAPSISGIDLIAQAGDSSPSFTPASFPHTPALVSSASNVTPPPLPVTDVTKPAAGAFIPAAPDSSTSSVTMSSGTLPGAEVPQASSKTGLTIAVALAAAVVGGGIAIAAYQSGSAQAPPPTESTPVAAATAPADEPREEAPAATAPSTASATPGSATSDASDETSAASAAAEEPSATAAEPPPPRRRPPRRRAPTAKPTSEDQKPALSEQLPTEL